MTSNPYRIRLWSQRYVVFLRLLQLLLRTTVPVVPVANQLLRTVRRTSCHRTKIVIRKYTILTLSAPVYFKNITLPARYRRYRNIAKFRDTEKGNTVHDPLSPAMYDVPVIQLRMS